MPLVMNWKNPPGVTTPKEVEKYFEEQGVCIIVSQTHRVSSGKLNTTFSGDETEVMKAWRIIKDREKQEILKRRNGVKNAT